jgi:DNA-binding NarL/FixJ family response regulator
MKLAAIAPRTITFHQERTERYAAAPARISLTSGARAPACSGDTHLTPRELEVLSLLCEGLPNKLIGRQLNISPGTVKIHVGKILSGLGASSRLQAVVIAQREGLVKQFDASTDETVAAGHAAFRAQSYQPRPLRAA